MWAKTINQFFESMSEYDNPNLSLHMAQNFLEIIKERVEFTVEDAITIKILKYEDIEEEEIDEEGFMFWLQFTFHKELVSELLSLKEAAEKTQNTMKKLSSELKTAQESKDKVDKTVRIEKLKKDMEKIKLAMGRIDGYRRTTFTVVKDLEGVNSLIENIRIYKERSM